MQTKHNNLIHQTILVVTALAHATAAPIPPPLIAASGRGLQVMSTLCFPIDDYQVRKPHVQRPRTVLISIFFAEGIRREQCRHH